MNRFFVEKRQISDDIIVIYNNDVKHIKNVLRLKTDDLIEIVSDGYIYETCIIEQTKSQIITKIINKFKGENETRTHIRLFQGLAKGNKMETILQKGTEIGIKEFYPIITNRTVVKIDDKKKEKNKLTRWNTIVEDASKQAKRDEIPKVMNILSFEELLELLKDEDNILLPYEDENKISIKAGLANMEDGIINIIIGPEGGFELEEIQRLKDIGAEVVSLGRRILRTETAGLVAAAATLYEKDDLGVV